MYATVSQVWAVLTAYERWASVVPGTVRGAVPLPNHTSFSPPDTSPATQTRVERLRLQGGPGTVVVRFRGALSLPLWRVAGASTLEFREQVPRPPRGRALEFRELDGTSPAGRFTGTWRVQPHGTEDDATDTEAPGDGTTKGDGAGAPRCQLTLQATLEPRPGQPELPADVVHRLLAQGVARALRGVAAASEALAVSQAGPSWLEAGQGMAPGGGSTGVEATGHVATSGLAPAAAAAVDASNPDGFGPRELWGAAALPLSEWAEPQFLGVGAVSLPEIMNAQQEPQQETASSSTLPGDAGSSPPADEVAAPALQEVHLRTLDTATELHRRAVATMRVAAPMEQMWEALTRWDAHSQFLPGVVDVQVLDLGAKRSGAAGRSKSAAQEAPTGMGGGVGSTRSGAAPFPLEAQPQGAQASPRAQVRARLQYLVARAMPYVALHGVCIMDVLAQSSGGGGASASSSDGEVREVQFRVVSPDAPPGLTGLVIRGKWLLSSDGSDSEDEEGDEADGVAKSGPGRATSTGGMSLLKLAIETRGTFVSAAAAGRAATPEAPLSERCVYEELPVLLTAFRAQAEALWAEARPAAEALQAARDQPAPAAAPQTATRPAPAVFAQAAALANNMPALRAALLAAGLGTTGVMPRREELRGCGSPNATTLEYAISAAGGFTAVASALGWSLAYREKKPRGYWDRYDNVRTEILAFIAEQGLEPGVMPSRQAFVEAGRKDLAKLPERWGGTASLAAELGLRPASEGVRRSTVRTLAWQAHVARTAAATGLTGQALFELAGSTYVPPQSAAAQSETDEEEEALPEGEEAQSLWLPDWRKQAPAAAAESAS